VWAGRYTRLSARTPAPGRLELTLPAHSRGREPPWTTYCDSPRPLNTTLRSIPGCGRSGTTPTACSDDAAFGYVNAFKDHVNVGFFYGALLRDPAHLLEGTGKRMRHVKLRPGQDVELRRFPTQSERMHAPTEATLLCTRFGVTACGSVSRRAFGGA
jgi:hypothetical protein